MTSWFVPKREVKLGCSIYILDDIRSISDCSHVEMEGDVMAPELTYS
jgi:hypothetical protein